MKKLNNKNNDGEKIFTFLTWALLSGLVAFFLVELVHWAW